MEEIRLDRKGVRKLGRRAESAVLNLRDAKLRNYPLKKITITPALGFLDRFPKRVVPIYITSVGGRRILPAFLKISRTTSTKVMKTAMPSIVAANPEIDSHGTVHYSEGPLLQIGSFYPSLKREQILERALKKAEDVTAFGWMLADLRSSNISAMEHFDPITMNIPAGMSKRRALQVQLVDAMGTANLRDAPTWAIKRIINFQEDKIKKRLMEERRQLWNILKKAEIK